MKLYNRNIMKRRAGDFHRQTITDRDAVVWSVSTTNFYALVKIQGSNTLIKAHYPRNWRTLPTWLKTGNSVRIRHRSGVQGYIELVGHGRAIPTPVEGGNLPPSVNQSDAIVDGMEVVPYASGGMNITVNGGTYRIDGETYLYVEAVTGYIVMDDPAPMIMGANTLMGVGDTVTPVVIDAAPAAGYGRYDALVIGTDGVVDYVKGTAVRLTGEPPYPSVPSGHLLVMYLFIYGGMTEITQSDIGVKWTTPYANTVTPSSSILTGDGLFIFPWDGGDDTPQATITLSVTDQYGNAKSIGNSVTVEMLIGTGQVGGGGSWGTSVTFNVGSSFSFTYERNQVASPQEIGPLIQVSFTGYPSLTQYIPIICLDVLGDPV